MTFWSAHQNVGAGLRIDALLLGVVRMLPTLWNHTLAGERVAAAGYYTTDITGLRGRTGFKGFRWWSTTLMPIPSPTLVRAYRD